MTSARTQVTIIGAGPAGLMLSPLLHLGGIQHEVLKNLIAARLHRFADGGEVDAKRQLAELALVTSTPAAATVVAENDVGMSLS